MARYTSVYSDFVARLIEVDILRRMALAKERQDPISQSDQINALCRGSIVLLCSHLEAFIRELGQLALESFYSKKVERTNLSNRIFYYISKNLLDEIEQTTDPERKSEKIFDFLGADLDYWSKSGPFPMNIDTERFNQGFASPGIRKIRKYFGRFGYSGYKADLQKYMKAQAVVSINMVNHLVDTRNMIAHGDLGATKTPAEIENMTKIIKRFCAATDSVFASWCRDHYCAIR